MGRQMISIMAQQQQQQQQKQPTSGTDDDDKHLRTTNLTDKWTTTQEQHPVDQQQQQVGIDYLANITPSSFVSLYASGLPASISGSLFESQYGSHHDTVTTIDTNKTYAVKIPTQHPIYENERVKLYSQLLKLKTDDCNEEKQRGASLGELMYQSHQSYSDCGLGSDGTDLIVDLTKSLPCVYGAKITGGGSGGTVCVLGDQACAESISTLVTKYTQLTSHKPVVFEGSSMGAAMFGCLVVNVSH
eukprot:TRINITY_DN66612_c4_g2_i1.p1 TRINITY_DN66612_c4_g2~~TRINITY_DN66612_c4_g2_i1.p1  ORF type:complete len:245 (+),score=54.24 TRINITY_DN66612_c4_g2_i1:3-737(+)